MTSFKSQIANNSVFMALCLLIVLALGTALVCIPKAELHLLLCDHHTPARDIFFKYYTRVAEWGPYVLGFLILLFGRIGKGVTASLSMALSGLATQIIKHLVQAPRPLTWFMDNQPDVSLPLVDGVQMNYWLSFPSGHTTAFFSMALVLSFLFNHQSSKTKLIAPLRQRITKHQSSIINHQSSIVLQIALVLLATLGAYSRIYLSQHFAIDIFGGILIGLMVTLLCFFIFDRFEDKKWYNFRLLTKK